MTDSHDGFRDLSGIGDMFKSCVAHMKVHACGLPLFSGLLHAHKVDGTHSKSHMHDVRAVYPVAGPFQLGWHNHLL